MNLFVYGTLLVPSIWEVVTARLDILSSPATLAGHRALRVKNADFPGLVASDDTADVVPGRVYFNLPGEVVARLDAYEDSFYRRDRVEVVAEGGESVEAETYRITREDAPGILSDDTWTLDWFEREALEDYLKKFSSINSCRGYSE